MVYIVSFVVFFVVILSIWVCVCFKNNSHRKKLTSLNPVVIVPKDIPKSKNDNDNFPKGKESDQLKIGERERTSLQSKIDYADNAKLATIKEGIIVKYVEHCNQDNLMR